MQAVAFETEAYALLDTMAYITSEVYTLVIGEAMGNAAMLVASGKKGNRFMLPHSRMMTCPPRMNRSFGSTVNMMIRAEDLEYNTQVYSRSFSGVVLLVTQDTKRGFVGIATTQCPIMLAVTLWWMHEMASIPQSCGHRDKQQCFAHPAQPCYLLNNADNDRCPFFGSSSPDCGGVAEVCGRPCQVHWQASRCGQEGCWEEQILQPQASEGVWLD